MQVGTLGRPTYKEIYFDCYAFKFILVWLPNSRKLFRKVILRVTPKIMQLIDLFKAFK